MLARWRADGQPGAPAHDSRFAVRGEQHAVGEAAQNGSVRPWAGTHVETVTGARDLREAADDDLSGARVLVPAEARGKLGERWTVAVSRSMRTAS